MKCLECSKEMKVKRVDHRYTECGLSNVVLQKIQVFHCAKCGEEEIVIPSIEELHKLIANLVAQKKQRLAPEEIRFLRSYLGFSGADFARTIGVTPESVSKWENGRESMLAPSEKLLRVLILSQVKPVRDYKALSDFGSQKATTHKRITFFNDDHQWKLAA